MTSPSSGRPFARNPLQSLLRAFAAPLLPLAAGCGAEGADVEDDLEVSSQAVMYGTPTYERPEVIRVHASKGNCTGTLIGKNTVLTAAHCFDYCKPAGLYLPDPASTAPAYTMHATNGTEEKGNRISMVLCQGSAPGWDDIALVRLQSQPTTSYTGAKVADQYPTNPVRTVIGYGFYTPTESGKKHYYEFTGNESEIASGDSGGPYFEGRLGDRGPITSVVSARKDYFFWSEVITADPIRLKQHIEGARQKFDYQNVGVAYRALVPSVGWTPSASDWEQANDPNNHIQIQQLNIWTSVSGVSLCAEAYLQDYGWRPKVCSINRFGVNAIAVGTYGKRLEAIKLSLATKPSHIDGIIYQVYRVMTALRADWEPVVWDGAQAGITGQSIPIQSIRIGFRYRDYAGPPCGSLQPGVALARNEAVSSCDGRFLLIMQPDGNLVLYQGPTALWSSGTWGTDGQRAVMQTDGNLVLYDSANRPLWSSGTWNNPGAYLAVQNDGNVVVYKNSTPLWATNTCCR